MPQRLYLLIRGATLYFCSSTLSVMPEGRKYIFAEAEMNTRQRSRPLSRSIAFW